MKKVLITGVGGLLGSQLAEWIIENKPDYKVIGIDDFSGGYEENVPKGVHLWHMDVVSHPIENCFEVNKFDYVFHFAAYAAEGLSPFIRSYNYTNNLVATSRIVTECIKHDVKRLVFTSSMAVYGHGWEGIRPFDESHQPQPIDPYGVAKYACELDIQAAGNQHNLDWCIIRPHNVYGKNQNIWDKYRNVLGIWMYQYLNNEPMTIFGNGSQKRAWSYIDECLEPLWNAATEPKASKEIINLGGKIHTTITQANNTLRKVISKSPVRHYGEIPIAFKEARHEVKEAYPTWNKSEELLGYKNTVTLEEGLTKMWDWAKEQPMKKQFVWSKYELEKGLYSFWK